ncbi:MAG: hypothetical protein MJ215_06740 [Spirochaetia bacterium]|nr:hypothetical protein [Spirochaetia bacterium]
MRKILLLLCLFCFYTFAAFAEENNVSRYEFIDFIGTTPAEVYPQVGVPGEVFPFRGVSAAEDDVVFYYPDKNLYLFFFQNKVWQFRLDCNFEGSIAGVHMGDSKDAVKSVLGVPYSDTGDSFIYVNPGQYGKMVKYKFKVRIYFDHEKVSDIYIYRNN